MALDELTPSKGFEKERLEFLSMEEIQEKIEVWGLRAVISATGIESFHLETWLSGAEEGVREPCTGTPYHLLPLHIRPSPAKSQGMWRGVWILGLSSLSPSYELED